MKEFTRTDEEIKKLLKRIQYFLCFIGFFFIIISGRLWYLQIYKGFDLRKYSENNRLKRQDTLAPRGLIFSRNKKPLINNYYALEVTLTPQYMKDVGKVSQSIAPIIKMNPKSIIEKINTSKKYNGLFYPISIQKQLTLLQTYKINLLLNIFPELNIREYIVRHYPYGTSAAQLLGYIGEVSKREIKILNSKNDSFFFLKPGDYIGKSGLEEIWEKDLRGVDGISFIEIDAHSRNTITTTKEFWNLRKQKPLPGHHLILTLDEDIQKATIKAMNRKDKIGPRSGVAIAMKSNGEILSWVSSPSFDPNLFSHSLSNQFWNQIKKNKFKPMLNKVIQNHYSPGSTIKPFLAIAALEKQIIKEDTLINSPGKIRLGRRYFHDHSKRGYGKINITDAIEMSSNTFFYQLGEKLTIDNISQYLTLFGFGEKTNIHLNGEISGFIPTRAWKKKAIKEEWQKGEDLVHAIGQGYILVTPIQMVVAYNAIATEGLIVKPFIVKSIFNSKNQIIKNFSPKIVKNLNSLINKDTFRIVKQALNKVVNGKRGTARWWKMKDNLISGKTGTSQVKSFDPKSLYGNCLETPLNERHHGWFAAFAPLKNPEITVVVLTENSCSGSSGSAPIARDIIQAYFKKHPIKR